MDVLQITGGHALKGSIAISGAKNAALPLMAASLMADYGGDNYDDYMVLENLPLLADTDSMAALLAHLGIAPDRMANADTMRLRRNPAPADTGTLTTAPYDIVRRMRASVLVLGPLLARYGQARVSLPGGCAIGTRPVDLHVMAMQSLGADIEINGGYIEARAPQGGLKGGRITFPVASVGATENALMAACLAQGETVVENAAREPEITDLATCLNAMGARIEGAGSSRIAVAGVETLKPCRHTVIPDRIEAGSFAIAAAMTGGDVTLTHCRPDHLTALWECLRATGAKVMADGEGGAIRITGSDSIAPVDIATATYPGFPTDLQAQFMAMMCLADGASTVSETIFENRFMHVPELNRMGARIEISGGKAVIHGNRDGLRGAEVMATDLRASMSLVLAALVAEGTTILRRIYHLDRGYFGLEAKLRACGAAIARLPDPVGDADSGEEMIREGGDVRFG